MGQVVLTVILLCLGSSAVMAGTEPSNRRSLLQSGPARFMNAPIINTEPFEQQEAGPAQQPKPTSKQPAATTDSQQKQPQPQAKKQQARGLLAADSANTSRRRRYDRRWRDERINRYRRYDRNTLSPWLAPINTYSNRPRQQLPILTGILSSLLQPGNPRATASSLAKAYSGGNSEAAAQAVAGASGAGSAQASTVAQALTETAASHPNVAPGLLAKSADLAVNRGQTDRYASTLANAFGYAMQQQRVPQLTNAVTQSIATGGDAARYATGTAIAQAIAQGGDSKAAVAEATATALCAGGSQAQAWSSAYAIALSQDRNGCLVLNEAKAMAQAKCGDGAADAVADAEASSTVLGFCGLLEGWFPDTELSFSGGNSGSTSTADGAGGLNSWGQGNQGSWGGQGAGNQGWGGWGGK